MKGAAALRGGQMRYKNATSGRVERSITSQLAVCGIQRALPLVRHRAAHEIHAHSPRIMVFIDADGNIRPDAERPKSAARARPAARSNIHSTTPSSSSAPGGGGGTPRNPLLALGDYLGLQDSVVEIPACPPLGCPATRQPAVYALAVGALTLFAGWRVLVATAALYVFNVRDAS